TRRRRPPGWRHRRPTTHAADRPLAVRLSRRRHHRRRATWCSRHPRSRWTDRSPCSRPVAVRLASLVLSLRLRVLAGGRLLARVLAGPLARILAQTPLGGELAVVGFDRIAQTLLQSIGEHQFIADIRADAAAHRLEDAAENAAQIFALELLHDLEEDLLHEDRVGGAIAGAGQGVFLHLRLELIPGHHAVEEIAVIHLRGGESPSGEDHLLELADTHGLRPPPHAGAPAVIPERR